MDSLAASLLHSLPTGGDACLAERLVLTALLGWEHWLGDRKADAVSMLAPLTDAPPFRNHPLRSIFRWILAHLQVLEVPVAKQLIARHMVQADAVWLEALPAADGVLPTKLMRKRLARISERNRRRNWFERDHLLGALIDAQADEGWWDDALSSIARLSDVGVRLKFLFSLATRYPAKTDRLVTQAILHSRRSRPLAERVRYLLEVAQFSERRRAELTAEVLELIVRARGRSWQWFEIAIELLTLGEREAAIRCKRHLDQDETLADVEHGFQRRASRQQSPFEQAVLAGDLESATQLTTSSSDWHKLARKAIERGWTTRAIEFLGRELRTYFVDDPNDVMNFTMWCGCCTPIVLATVRWQFQLGGHAAARRSVAEVVEYYVSHPAP